MQWSLFYGNNIVRGRISEYFCPPQQKQDGAGIINSVSSSIYFPWISSVVTHNSLSMGFNPFWRNINKEQIHVRTENRGMNSENSKASSYRDSTSANLGYRWFSNGFKNTRDTWILHGFLPILSKFAQFFEVLTNLMMHGFWATGIKNHATRSFLVLQKLKWILHFYCFWADWPVRAVKIFFLILPFLRGSFWVIFLWSKKNTVMHFYPSFYCSLYCKAVRGLVLYEWPS